MVKVKSLFQKGYLGLVLLFLYAPIATLIIFSFNVGKTMGKWSGFSLKWYEQLFQDPSLMSALSTTLTIAVLSALIATVIGTLAAIGIHSMRKRTRSLVETATYIPMLNPDIVTGISLMLLFLFLRVSLGYTTLLLAHITFNIPYVIFSVLPKLRQMPQNLYEAALDLGCKPTRAMWKIIVPQIMPGIVTGAIFALTLSIDDFVVSYFTTQGVSNLSIAIYAMARRGISPKINALSAIIFVSIVTLLLIVNIRANRVQNGKEKKA
ncbi:ABC transporter permease [Christensenella sp. MSJ-20]|uniref:ABC transporter permease n=1 Tax=Christensenella sp. MSJ-20 TaxID=2841518 RepID=UPI0037C02A34